MVLKFLIEENPPWRSKRASSQILEAIALQIDTSKVKKDKRRSLFIDFVYYSNIGEDVGTQTKEETARCLEKIKLTEEGSLSREDLETTNTYKALEFVEGLFNDTMARSGLLTVQEICDIHRILMEGLHPEHGSIRKTEVYTNTRDGERYNYPHCDEVENILYGVVDRHNIHMEQLRESSMSTYDKLVALVKNAAWLLFHFVDTHPFGDGNGRMCRLLAAYTMMIMTPFPVHPYYVTTKEGYNKPSREDYIDAIISCRRHPNKEPSMIAALLVDALGYGWQTYVDCGT